MTIGSQLLLLGGFELRCGGDRVWLPLRAQRLLAFLALQERPTQRAYAAGALWLDTTDEHATGSLRSALWRLRRPGHALVEAHGTQLWLSPDVTVDYRRALARARALLGDGAADPGGEAGDDLLTRELLPDWFDDWVAVERERFRHLRMHALEALCRRLAAARRFPDAVQAGLAAIACEPLRDNAHHLLISVHLAEGNRVEALRHFQSYRRLLRDELGLGPSPQVEALVSHLRTGPAAASSDAMARAIG
jgi:DNA-binding SARP family transcriptional activator